MLMQAIGDLLPFAVGVALSPIPIVAVVLVLGTPRARGNGPAFAVGWVVGLVVVSVVVLALAGGADDPDSATASGVNWFQVGVGLLFLGMAVQQWRKRPRDGDEPEMPKWTASVDSLTTGKSLATGLLLSAANPKNLVLTSAAAAAIARAGLPAAETAAAVAVFVVIASSTVAGSVVYYLVATERAARALAGMKQFMTAHNAAIMAVILLLLGAKLLGDGLGGLA